MAAGHRFAAPGLGRARDRSAQRMAAALLMLTWGSCAWGATAFDKSIWQPPMGYDDVSPRRLDMLPDVLAHLTDGTSASDVGATLGTPEADFTSEWVYFLGKPNGEDSKVLIVFFNGDGLLVSAREYLGAAYAPPDGARMIR